MSSLIKTIFFLAVLAALVTGCGYVLGGRQGMMAAFSLAGLMNLGFYWFSDRIVLSMCRAQPLAEEEAPEVFEIVRTLSARAGIPMPRIYMLPSASSNAFITGRDPKHAVIAVTHGLVGLLNEEELSGVFAHEISHLLNRDVLLSSIVAALAGALSMVASMYRWSFYWGGERDERDNGHPLALLAASILMPLVAVVIQLSISRSREYGADTRGAELCGEPLYLASALRKIDVNSQRFPLREAGPATAHLFIANPLSGKGWSSLFRTHPPIEDRIARLESMSRMTAGRV